jgi:hypothetical protein
MESMLFASTLDQEEEAIVARVLTETNSTRRSANDQQGIMSRIKRSVLMCCMIPRCLHRRDDQAPTSRSNRSTSQKRAILDMRSHGFSFSYLFLRLIFASVSCYTNSECLPDSPSRSLQLVSVHVPESEERQEIKERRAELVLV